MIGIVDGGLAMQPAWGEHECALKSCGAHVELTRHASCQYPERWWRKYYKLKHVQDTRDPDTKESSSRLCPTLLPKGVGAQESPGFTVLCTQCPKTEPPDFERHYECIGGRSQGHSRHPEWKQIRWGKPPPGGS